MTASEDFTSVTDPFRAELLAHCYRMVGSADQAEDLVQETYLRAWRSYAGFQGRSSVRTWLSFLASNVFRVPGQFRLVATAANGQPAFATYQCDRDGVYRTGALQVLTVTSGGVTRIVIFLDPGLFGSFRLPPVYGPAAAGAVLTGADRAGHRGAC